MTGLLAGKNLLVTGVLTESSIAYGVAKHAQKEGATVLLSSYGRATRITRIVAESLPHPAPVIELDVTNEADLAAVPDRVREHCPHLDGVLHAVAFAPPSALGGGFLDTPWADAATTLHVSAYSLKALVTACLPVLRSPAAVVGLDFDASIAWPGYDWMGVAKAALESTSRYLCRDLGPRGIRVNLVAAGPLRTKAATSIPTFTEFDSAWDGGAPLGWDVGDTDPAARACVALLSDWFPSTSGEIVHVDGGFHVTGGVARS
ncbi:enoyl-[acyl-carrier protein] reductase I [Nocardia transvalensis]|uniref:Enoyl-[acyl-carrier-protein] reductase [NADH] n=1 Tax=Nocardia transvalensis TaxID=37333 RepID=A0A7W9UM77_9NOCA|nr:enoyl-ACP reductase FabI [Nocardia transvalensis]MBB5918331.1 enoyl-[acyl-carrier protein] reductase I [Nocardia transvalensis]